VRFRLLPDRESGTLMALRKEVAMAKGSIMLQIAVEQTFAPRRSASRPWDPCCGPP